MTDPIYRCPIHGTVTPDAAPTSGDRAAPGDDGGEAACPECGREADRLLSGERRRRLSKFLSGALRHFPDDVGLSLSRAGWVDRAALVAAATDRYDWAAPEHVGAVIATDPKGRFEARAGRVRAAYGHSVEVDLDADGGGGAGAAGAEEGAESAIPDRLYHGTAPRNLEAIEREGLKSMGRREVHLSGSAADAREVGRRHAADPVVLAVDAASMLADGRPIRQRGPETYTTDRVPPEYLSRSDG